MRIEVYEAVLKTPFPFDRNYTHKYTLYRIKASRYRYIIYYYYLLIVMSYIIRFRIDEEESSDDENNDKTATTPCRYLFIIICIVQSLKFTGLKA